MKTIDFIMKTPYKQQSDENISYSNQNDARRMDMAQSDLRTIKERPNTSSKNHG